MRVKVLSRQGRGDVGDLVAHRARPAVAVEGDGVVRQRRPLGVEGDVRREGVGGAIGIGGARAVGSRVPAAERVACAGEGVGRQGGGDVGDLVAHRARPAVGVEGDGMVRQRPSQVPQDSPGHRPRIMICRS